MPCKYDRDSSIGGEEGEERGFVSTPRENNPNHGGAPLESMTASLVKKVSKIDAEGNPIILLSKTTDNTGIETKMVVALKLAFKSLVQIK